MNMFQKLNNRVKQNNSRLCAGMDPQGIAVEDLKEWAEIVIETLKDKVACFKPNGSFFPTGVGEEALAFITSHPEIISILDVKVGDIGSTQEARAKKIKEFFNPDFVTINGYMGSATWEPFNKIGIPTFVVVKSSNPEGVDLQERSFSGLSNSEFLAKQLNNSNNINGFVIGASGDVDAVKRIRAIAPNSYWLMPGGIGPQAKPNSLKTLQYVNDRAIINASRGLTGIPSGMDFKSPEYKELLINRANELNAIINKNVKNTPVDWKNVVVDDLLNSKIFQLKGERVFKYKNGGFYTTYFQGRHLTGQKLRVVNSATHLIIYETKKKWGEDYKPDFVAPVLMGGIGFDKVAQGFNSSNIYLRPEKLEKMSKEKFSEFLNDIKNNSSFNIDDLYNIVYPKAAGNQESIVGIANYDELPRNIEILAVEDIFSSGGSSIASAQKMKDIFASKGINANIKIISLCINKLNSIDNIEKAGFEATSCLQVSEMVGITLKQNPSMFTKDEIKTINDDIKERLNVDVVAEYGIK